MSEPATPSPSRRLLAMARAVGAIVFAVVIGVIMHLIYRREEQARAVANGRGFEGELSRPLGQVGLFFGLMVGILMFANWAAADSPAWMAIHAWKWQVTAVLAGLFALLLIRRWGWPLHQVAALAGAVVLAALLAPGVPELAFAVGIIGLLLIATLREEDRDWAIESWGFTRQIMPLLLAGPALSLPNMLVIRTIMGTQKTLVYCTLVVVMATLTGYLYGQLWP